MEGQRRREARNSLIKITRPTDEAWAEETGREADCANGWSEGSGHAKKRRKGFDSQMREAEGDQLCLVSTTTHTRSLDAWDSK